MPLYFKFKGKIMMNLQDEKQILNIIKYSPIIFLLVISIFTTQLYLIQREKDFNDEIEITKEKFLINNKKRVKDEIERISEFLIFKKAKAEELLKEELKNRVYEAHTIVKNIYDKEKSNHTKEELFLIIKSILKSMSYDNSKGYYFISDKKGKNLLSSFNKKLENKNFLDIGNKNEHQFVKKFINTIKNKSESFDSYYWYKPNDDKNTYKKISFYKYFEPFDIIIGMGKYVDEYEATLQKELLSELQHLKDNASSYVFIFDEKGIVLSHYKDSLIGTNRYNVKNPLGEYVVRDIIDFSQKKKEGFLTYNTGVNPKNLQNREKISYIKLINTWNWTIGTGFFLEDLNSEIEEKTKKLLQSKNESVNKIIVFSVIITLFFIFITFYLSKNISEKFYSYKNKIEEEVNNTIEKEKLLIQQSKMASMGEMIANITHQWKQPLTMISMASSSLSFNKEFDRLEDEDFYRSVNTIDNSVKNLNTTITDFSNFFNPNKKSDYFNLTTIFEKTLKLIDSQFKHNGIEIIKEIEDIKFYGLENELLQTFINILKNSKDELIKRNVNQKRLIFINAYKKENKLIIKIKDNAGGIPNKIINKIFDPYFTTKEEEGTGIGLYMSKQIIESINGSIEVENVNYTFDDVVYQGAEFTIYLDL